MYACKQKQIISFSDTIRIEDGSFEFGETSLKLIVATKNKKSEKRKRMKIS